MRTLIQRVSQCRVEVGEELVSEIGKGILVLLGIGMEDLRADAEWLARKITRLRIFPDDTGKTNFSVANMEGEILVVSQFTLYGNCKRGNRPTYTRAASPPKSIDLYEYFLEQLKTHFEGNIATGKFGADMKVSLTNDGPITLLLDSKQKGF